MEMNVSFIYGPAPTPVPIQLQYHNSSPALTAETTAQYTDPNVTLRGRGNGVRA